MSEPYVGEIRLFPYTFAPNGWFDCDGRLLSIAEYEVLFTLLGTTYGGDGATTFALPDLRGRVPVHQGAGTGLSTYVLGQMAPFAQAKALEGLRRALAPGGCLVLGLGEAAAVEGLAGGELGIFYAAGDARTAAA